MDAPLAPFVPHRTPAPAPAPPAEAEGPLSSRGAAEASGAREFPEAGDLEPRRTADEWSADADDAPDAAPAAARGADEDLPWLITQEDHREEESAASGNGMELASAMHGWDDGVGADEREAVAGAEQERASGEVRDPASRPAEPAEGGAGAGLEEAEEEWYQPWDEEPVDDHGEVVEPARPAAESAGRVSGRVMEQIAERLEEIARSLRAREAGDLTGDSNDPLEVLITGYALGYSEGLRRGGAGEDASG